MDWPLARVKKSNPSCATDNSKWRAYERIYRLEINSSDSKNQEVQTVIENLNGTEPVKNNREKMVK